MNNLFDNPTTETIKICNDLVEYPEFSDELVSIAKVNKVWAKVGKKILIKRRKRGENLHLREEFKKVEKNLDMQKKTLKDLKSVFGNRLEYLIIRTKRSMDYVTWDIDVVVRKRDLNRAIDLLKSNKYKVTKHGTLNGIKKGWQINAIKKGNLNIDLHINVSWLGSVYISEEDIWTQTTTDKIAGIMCPVVSAESDFLLICANVLYEKFHLTILDYLYLRSLLPKTDFNKVLKVAGVYGWEMQISELHTFLTERNLSSLKKIFVISKRINFPLVISPLYAVRLFVNRFVSKRGLSLVGMCYVGYLYLKMLIYRGKYFPYYYA